MDFIFTYAKHKFSLEMLVYIYSNKIQEKQRELKKTVAMDLLMYLYIKYTNFFVRSK